jgi:protein-disulfide isomerase
VTIVMFTEFQCPFCARAVPTLRDLQAAYPQEVRLVFKNLPLPFHESAGLAAEAALAAGEQGKFWEMHDRLFENQERLDPAALEEHARALALDVPRFKAALDTGKFRAKVEADARQAKEAGLTGTPIFLINGEKLVGAQPLGSFKHQVDVALARVRGLPPPPDPLQAIKAELAKPPAGKPRMMMSPLWPPPAVNLPEAMLGERVSVRFPTARAPLRGNPKAPVEVLYFTALSCGKCQQARYVLEGLLGTYGEQVRVLAQVVPQGGGGDDRPLVAEAALAAHAQGKFWPFHDRISRVGGLAPPDRAELEKIAQEIGLDLDDFRAALDDGRYRAGLAEDQEAQRAAKIAGAGFVVGGRLADGTTALAQLVETAIKKAGRRPPPRTAAGPAPETNPRQPGYDPQRLLMHLSARQLFAGEPRDDAWAAAVEKELAPLVDRDLRAVEPKLASTAVDCRSTLCRIGWRAGRADEKAVAAAADYLFGGNGAQRPGELYLVLRTDVSKSAADSLVRLRSRRATLIYNQRTGRLTSKPRFPVERLPKE